jgi:hypothetical protein
MLFRSPQDLVEQFAGDPEGEFASKPGIRPDEGVLSTVFSGMPNASSSFTLHGSISTQQGHDQPSDSADEQEYESRHCEREAG